MAALASILALAGGFLMRYLMVMAGRASSDDPQATIEFTRAKSSPESVNPYLITHSFLTRSSLLSRRITRSIEMA